MFQYSFFRRVLLAIAAWVGLWLAVGSVSAQSNPTQPSSLSRAIFFIDQSHGWIAGEAGAIWATTDGGRTWKNQDSGSKSDLYSIRFADPFNGWAIGGSGTVLRTDDGGRTWRRLQLPIPRNLLAISSLGIRGRTALITTTSGTVLRSTDDGFEWNEHKISDSATPLWDIKFIDNTLGWVVGDGGVVAATRDGGATWSTQDASTTSDLTGVAFFDDTNGFAVGHSQTLIVTSNGGKSWSRIPAPPNFSLISVNSIGRRFAYATGMQGLAISRDGGLTWEQSPFGRKATEAFFLDSDLGWAVGAGAIVQATMDGGVTWKDYRLPLDAAPIEEDSIAQIRRFLQSDYLVLWAAASIGAALMMWLIVGMRLRRARLALEKDKELFRYRIDRPDASAAAIEALTEQEPIVPDIPDGLVDRLLQEECCLFWGGGLSAQAGYPTWREALQKMIDGSSADTETRKALIGALDVNRYSLVIDALASRLTQDQLLAQLTELWGQSQRPSQAIQRLANLPFSNAVTTVWDPLIEDVFALKDPVIVTGANTDESLDALLRREAFCIVRLWGALNRPDSIVFTPNEYRTAVAANPNFAKYVSSLTLSQSHFFIGASLDAIEEYISAVPRHSASSSHVHYALVPKSDQTLLATEVFRNRGVELIVFEPTPGWPEVSLFIEKLRAAVDSRARTRPRPPSEPVLLRNIELENIGPFTSLSLDLDPSWTVLLGNNGAGKSTVLKAISLVVCGEDSRAMIEGAKLLKAGAKEGSIKLTIGSTATVRLFRETQQAS